MLVRFCEWCGLEIHPTNQSIRRGWGRFCDQRCFINHKCSDSQLRKRFESKIEKTPNGCWLWKASFDECGYGHIKVRGKERRSPRVSWFLYKGSWPKQQILHRCDNRACVNPEHLFEGTHLENMQDKKKKGRASKKLTEAIVRDIRTSEEPIDVLATRFGVSKSTINHVRSRRTWK